MLEIRLLGQFNLRQDGVLIELPSRPARTLLAYLVLTLGMRHPREKLAGLLWPDSSERNARKNLRQALWHLRKAIGEAHLLVDTASIGFDKTSDFWLDIGLLENAADQDLETEVSVYEGELLPGFYEDWVLLERDRLDAVYERKMQRLLAKLLQEGRWSEVLDWAERWIAQGQVPEAAYRALMMAQAALGELSKVETVYQRCIEALRQEVEVGPSEETHHLYKSLLAGEKISPYPSPEKPGQVASIAPQRASLPAQPTPFIGRREELAQIKRLLSTTRLLTLSGPGGMGKTRLALKAAEEIAGNFQDGSFFVPLAPIRSVGQLIQTIAEAVKFPIATHDDPLYQLLRYLEHRQLLLVLDNFEHLLDGVGIVSEILRAAPAVQILATSREKLNLQSETNLIVRGMSLPGQAELEYARKDDAIALFLQSAGKVRPGFEPSPDELGQIVNICQHVQGMPLAIELAAGWLHILNVDEIAEELEKGLDILSTGVRDAPERHRSIRAVFDHSWCLLDQAEQEIFLLLSVFRGGFTRQAAQQVAGASLQLLTGLVNKSFLSHDPNSGRLEVHELLRQYAQERLEKTPEASLSALEAHAAFYAEFIQHRWQHLKNNRQMLALAEIEADIENVRAAWRYCLDQRNAPQMWMFINGLWLFYWIRWWNHAGMELFAEAVRNLQGEEEEEFAALRALAMAYQGYFMAWLDLSDQGYELAKEGVEILEQLNHPEALALAYVSLGMNAYFLNRYTDEIKAVNKMLKIAAEMDDKWLLAFSLFEAGMGALVQKDYAEARRLAESNLKLYEEMGNVIGSTMPLIVLGHAALASGELEEASEFYLRCLEISQEVDFLFSIQNASKYLGKVTLSLGKIAKAENYLVQSLRITKEIGFARDIINLLYEFARLRVAQGKPEQAAELLALVIQHPASYQVRMLEGRIRDSAKRLLAELEDELPQEIYTAALERGKELELEHVVPALLELNDS